MSALGDAFRAARESQGLTLSDVAERIHIRSVYLAAIEAGDWSSIGPAVYVRGFVRSYARCLGLDPESAVSRIDDGRAATTSSAAAQGRDIAYAPRPAPAPATASVATVPPRAATAWPSPLGAEGIAAPRRGLSLGAIAGVLVALGLVLFVGYEYMELSRSENAPATGLPAPTAQPLRAVRDAQPRTAAPAAEPRPVARAAGVALRLRDSSWLRVVVDGRVAMQGVFPKGTARNFSGRSATVRVGNAGGVDIAVDGKDLGPMGGLGDVAERSYQLEAH